MALTGVIQRRNSKAFLIQNPPRVGEIVYSLDTDEYGSLQNGSLIWRKFNESVSSVVGKTGNVLLNKSDVDLENVDNTSDINKPISNPTKKYVNEQIDIISTKNSISKSQMDSSINLLIFKS